MNKIKELRKEFNITQNKLCSYLGITQGALSGWENERYEPDLQSLKKMAELFNTSIDYILGNTLDRKNKEEKYSLKIPVYGSVAAGIPIEAIQDIIDYEEVDKETAKKGELFGLKIKGTSMEPRICDGDIVIVLRQNYIEDGQVGIIMVNGDEATCKKVKFSEAGITLISNNPAYEPMFYTKEEIETLPIRVIGKVIELRGKNI